MNDTLNGPDAISMLSHPKAPAPSQKIDEPLSVTVNVAVKPLVALVIVTGVDSFATPNSFATPVHWVTPPSSAINSPLLFRRAPVSAAPAIDTVSDASQVAPGLKVVRLSVKVAGDPEVVLVTLPVEDVVEVE